jgi:hypothetical protein
MKLREWLRSKLKAELPAANVEGRTLQPGESLTIALPEPLATELAEFHAAGRSIIFEHGRIRRNGERFSREVSICVDGRKHAKFVIGWSE